MAALAPLGFTMLDTGSMTFDEQSHAFANASHVVGVMGAAMTNTVFCRAEASVCYLAPEGWTEPFFWDLAAVMGQEYRCVLGRAEGSDLPPQLQDFTIEDVEELRQLCG